MYRLISHAKPPPPGYFKIWVRPNNGEAQFLSQHCGDCAEFAETQVADVVRNVLSFISANGLRSVAPTTIADLVDQLSCQRLGNSSEWCYDTDNPNPATARVVSGGGGCGSCGARV